MSTNTFYRDVAISAIALIVFGLFVECSGLVAVFTKIGNLP